jgi:omega-6 fatty acid desaturase (delta-12 desaturase)
METRLKEQSYSSAPPLGARKVAPPAGVSGIREVYVWGSSGPTVLLVHGWGSDSSAMFSMAREIRKNGYCVAAFDTPGHGTNAGRHTTMTDFVRVVREMIESFRPDEPFAAIVGHSLGGLATVAALHTASRRPEHLVLVSSPRSLTFSLNRFLHAWRLGRKTEHKIRQELLKSHGVLIEHWDMRTLTLPSKPKTLIVHDQDDSVVPHEQAQEVLKALGGDADCHFTRNLGHGRILIDSAVLSLIAKFVAPKPKLAAVSPSSRPVALHG